MNWADQFNKTLDTAWPGSHQANATINGMLAHVIQQFQSDPMSLVPNLFTNMKAAQGQLAQNPNSPRNFMQAALLASPQGMASEPTWWAGAPPTGYHLPRLDSPFEGPYINTPSGIPKTPLGFYGGDYPEAVRPYGHVDEGDLAAVVPAYKNRVPSTRLGAMSGQVEYPRGVESTDYVSMRGAIYGGGVEYPDLNAHLSPLRPNPPDWWQPSDPPLTTISPGVAVAGVPLQPGPKVYLPHQLVKLGMDPQQAWMAEPGTKLRIGDMVIQKGGYGRWHHLNHPDIKAPAYDFEKGARGE